MENQGPKEIRQIDIVNEQINEALKAIELTSLKEYRRMTDKFFEDSAHFKACHERWMEKRNRKQEEPNYKDEWYGEQCGMCRYFIPLGETFVEDYGACSNSSSKFDGFVRFEHDGCDVFSESEGY